MKDIEFGRSSACVEESKSDSEIKHQILEKLAKRREFLECGAIGKNFCAELNPDVIVISDDQGLLFETQNSRASAWLYARYRVAAESDDGRERIRVHSCETPKIVAELKAAGFVVVT